MTHGPTFAFAFCFLLFAGFFVLLQILGKEVFCARFPHATVFAAQRR